MNVENPEATADRTAPAAGTRKAWTPPQLVSLGGMDDVMNSIQVSDDGSLNPQLAAS